MPMQERILFIGGGNMAASLIGGLRADGVAAARLAVVEPQQERRDWLAAQFPGVTALKEVTADAMQTEVVVLAVKPQVMSDVTRALAPLLPDPLPLMVSIAAGIRMEDLQRWLGAKIPLVRTMPNTPALIRCGATALCANAEVSTAQRACAERLLRAVGLCLWIQHESQMDAVTALSGSGPAYFFAFMEALQQAGESLGLSAETARLLTLQTALGASRMAMESSDPPAVLRAQVTSKGGTTEAALNQLREGGFDRLVHQALAAANNRSKTLADQFGR